MSSRVIELAGRHRGGNKLRKFLREHPSVNSRICTKPFGKWALHCAVWYGNDDCVEVLLDAGVPVNEPNPSGSSAFPHGRLPLQTAVCGFAKSRGENADRGRRRRRAIVDILISAGADVDLKDKQGMTALDYAAFYGPAVGDRRGIILALLRAGASHLPQQPRARTDQILRGEVASDRELKKDISRHESSYALIDKFREAGGFKKFAQNHRRILSSIVSKCACARTGSPSFCTDAAGHVVDFWCPFGGH